MLTLARTLILLGVILVVVGGVFYLFARTGVTIGRLPGDLRIERGNFTCVVAIGTSILISLLLTIILNVIIRMLNK